ncbi:TrmB family transcriptional regulator [Halococcoides cellulosivorans]|uniref:TrmB family transcriptional regulator n=1 Tax=Halococcoides cellulosivorans TaxID=1679096 RepID=UPI00131F031B|nr:TrmB family transcriptional regulator sugar-binding domain-containing protein [Halococcoides cellulosivorans]
MDRDALSAVLEDAGLSQYQAEAYVTVLEHGSATATDVANDSEVPDPRIYDVLRDLEQQGYVETYQQDSLRVRAFSPERIRSDLRDRATQFESAADEIDRRWEEPSVESHSVNFVKREQTVLDHAEAAIDDAECQVMVAASADQIDHLDRALGAAVDRGVYVMVVVSPTEGCCLRDRIESGGLASSLRVRPDPTPFLTLVDRTITCFAPHDMSLNRFGIIVDAPSHAFIFRWFYTVAIWETATQAFERAHDAVRICVNLGRCVRELRPILADGATVRATVHGANTRTGEAATLTGRITDVTVPGAADTDGTTPTAHGSGPTLEIEVDGDRVAVGDWGAIVEPYEAMRIEIRSIDWP